MELPIVGLVEECILPGEERTFAPPAVTAATLAAIAKRRRVCALTVSSMVELPSFVTGRWGSECRVVAISASSVTLAAERRVRITSARGSEGAFTAEVIPGDDDASPSELARAAHLLTAAVDGGALPLAPGRAEDVARALAALMRACADDDLAKRLTSEPLRARAEMIAKELAARAPAEQASADIEQMLAEAGKSPELPKALHQRLWSQSVEIMKRLDVYDPATREDEGDVTKLQNKLMQAGLPKPARAAAKRELRLLRAMKADHHDYATYVAHLELMATLPWHPDPVPPPDLARVAEALDREHAGLEKPKRRILEYLAVRALGGTAASTVLCLVGPPGIGKTTLARAMASALGRAFVRVPLGGVHDECEIRGFRKSFQAASAGRLLTGIAQAGSASAVVLLDEIDKLGTDRARSPAGALHEVLDPEQNTHFQDNYLGVPYDLSHALFVCTANDTGAISPTLLDRLEVIELDGYSAVEKAAIARSHLLPKLTGEHGLDPIVGIDDEALDALIEQHTRESGVRQLSRALASVLRARALALYRAAGTADEPAARARATQSIDSAEVAAALGAPHFARPARPETLPVGVATGLSVGPDGGALLYVEAGAMPGTGKLRTTGRLGDVLRESAHTALNHLRLDPARYGLEPAALGRDVHVHLPEGATPKDGPSAGIALAVAFASVARGVPVRSDVAFTGEITLTGRVLPVGGVRAKVLAAERAGLRAVVLPVGSALDAPKGTRVSLVEVDHVSDALAIAFEASAPEASTQKKSMPAANGRARARREEQDA